MSMTRQRQQFLKTLFAEIESDPKPMSEFEVNFMKDQKERFDKYGSEMYLSVKQMAIIIRVGEKYQLHEEDPDHG